MTTEEDATEWDVVEAKLAELKQRESARDKAVDNLYSALRAERVEHAGTKRQLDRMIQLLEDARRERDRLRGVHFDKTQLEDQIAALTKERDEARDAYTRCGVSLSALTKNLEGQIEDVSKERDAARKELDAIKSGVDWKQLAIDEEQRHRETRKTLTEALERVREQAASTVAERDRLRKLVKRYVDEQREMSSIRKAMFDAADD